MIRSFKDRRAEQIWNRQSVRGIAMELQKAALKKLRMLNRSRSLMDLAIPPSNMLEKLHGDRKGQCSIRINRQWRLCFVFKNGDAYEVEIVDYH